MTKKKQSKSKKRTKRRKLSKLLNSFKKPKERIPTCKGSVAFKPSNKYDRKKLKNSTTELINDWKHVIIYTNYLFSSVYIFYYVCRHNYEVQKAET